MRLLYIEREMPLSTTLIEIKEYWEQATPMKFDTEKWDYEQKRAFRYKLQDYMQEAFRFADFEGQSVLDIGCGAGIDAAEFARHGAKVTAIDLTQTGVELTRNLLTEARLSAIVRQADVCDLPFEDARFDCVYTYGVLHHIPNVNKALFEIQRVLKTGGKVMAMLYNKDSLLYGYSIMYQHGVKDGWLATLNQDELVSRFSERNEFCPYTKAYQKSEAIELFGKFFGSVEASVYYNVIDLPHKRKVKVDIPNEYELGWHIVVKAVKGRR